MLTYKKPMFFYITSLELSFSLYLIWTGVLTCLTALILSNLDISKKEKSKKDYVKLFLLGFLFTYSFSFFCDCILILGLCLIDFQIIKDLLYALKPWSVAYAMSPNYTTEVIDFSSLERKLKTREDLVSQTKEIIEKAKSFTVEETKSIEEKKLELESSVIGLKTLRQINYNKIEDFFSFHESILGQKYFDQVIIPLFKQKIDENWKQTKVELNKLDINDVHVFKKENDLQNSLFKKNATIYLEAKKTIFREVENQHNLGNLPQGFYDKYKDLPKKFNQEDEIFNTYHNQLRKKVAELVNTKK
jgi:hypothetical protein